MTRRAAIYFTLLGAYSVALILAELLISQDYVRLYLTDIIGPVDTQIVPFYAVNTTLTCFLLLGTALLFFLTERFSNREQASLRERLFLRTQVVLFAVLGCDDRFQLHEALGLLLKINDALVIAFWGVLELAALIWLGRIYRRTPKARAFVLTAALLFLAMVLIDGWVPEDLAPRLSVEDLLKMWAIVFLFLFGLEELDVGVRAAKVAARQ